MRVVRPAIFCLVALLTGCADDPTPGVISPCDTPGGPLTGCAPPSASLELPTIEEACARLVDCGVLLVDQQNESGDHFGDYTSCVNDLRGDEFSAARLDFVLRCIDVSTCQDLSAEHCITF